MLDENRLKRDNWRQIDFSFVNNAKGGLQMKIVKFVLVLVFLCAATFAFSQNVVLQENFSSSSLSGWKQVSGSWRAVGGKLVQTDRNENMAMITVPVWQSGRMMYEFDLEYVSGGEDDYAGFGIHVCTSNPTNVRSWGNGQSILGWVTYDPRHYGYPGAYIQVYESTGKTSMGLHKGIYPSSDPLRHGDLIAIPSSYMKYEYISATVPFKLMIDTATGEGRFYDPVDPDRYYYAFDLGTSLKPGGYLTFRTNSVSVRIDNIKVTRYY